MQLSLTTEYRIDSAESYLRRLCRHFSHKVLVTLEEGSGRVEFPFGSCQLNASDSQLAMEATALSEPQLQKTIEVIVNHLQRFTKDEAVGQLQWQ
ncbi:DUF2218 domain-containing protein [Motiliproteus coralliicola]|uniref:DUF2218 domain-containing protein n=1 Tax=Motiliproteus coralliicola TaxID=2283196 RepID=A0A369WQM0_9GAMM|nr:DUF2218 domain-containing protein [Motiliproteus coralliicola]RDE22914.1 DUF2218 domain-containing protein [Motiliproteus coralliicola]